MSELELVKIPSNLPVSAEYSGMVENTNSGKFDNIDVD